MRLVLVALVVALPAAAGCNPVARTISTSVIDQTSGTAYGFEVADPRRGSDYDAVVICNVEFPQPCYRVYLTDLHDEDARELVRIVREIRSEAALVEHQERARTQRVEFRYEGSGSLDAPTSAGADTGSAAPRTTPPAE